MSKNIVSAEDAMRTLATLKTRSTAELAAWFYFIWNQENLASLELPCASVQGPRVMYFNREKCYQLDDAALMVLSPMLLAVAMKSIYLILDPKDEKFRQDYAEALTTLVEAADKMLKTNEPFVKVPA